MERPDENNYHYRLNKGQRENKITHEAYIDDLERYSDYLESKLNLLTPTAMALDLQEKHDLKEILVEVQASINTYEKMKETGNSQGEHKEFYRGKYEAYSRQKVLLERYMRWHGIIEQNECIG